MLSVTCRAKTTPWASVSAERMLGRQESEKNARMLGTRKRQQCAAVIDFQAKVITARSQPKRDNGTLQVMVRNGMHARAAAEKSQVMAH